MMMYQLKMHMARRGWNVFRNALKMLEHLGYKRDYMKK